MKFEMNSITKEEFLKINEDDVMFITNPGRMGDEDGSTFIVKNGDKYKIYRIGNWLYGNKYIKTCDLISLNDEEKQFPKWYELWKNNRNKQSNEKYTYLYMGFGNGLSVDNSVIDEFKIYLDKRVQEYLKDADNKNDLKFAAIFNTWKNAFIDMINDREGQ